MPGITYSIEFDAAIARLVQNTATGSSAVKKMADEMESAAGFATKALGAIGVSLGIEHFAEMIHGATEATAQFKRLGEVAGTSAEMMSGFDLPARLAGTSLDTVAASIAKLGKSIGEARLAGGVGEKAELLKALGIDINDGRDAAAAMVDLSSVLTQMTDKEVAGAAASKLMGRGFSELRPLMQEIVEQGGIAARVTNEQAEEAKKLADQYILIKLNSDKMKEALARDLAPALMQVTQAMLDMNKGGTAVHEVAEVISAALKGAVSLGLAAIDVFYAVGHGIAAVGAAAALAASGDFKLAYETINQADKDIEEHTRSTNERIAKLWEDGGKKVVEELDITGEEVADMLMAQEQGQKEQNVRDLMEFNKHAAEKIAAVQGFAARYAEAIKSQNALAAEAVKAGDISEKDHIRQVAANEDALLQVKILALRQEEAIHKRKGDLAAAQKAADGIAAAEAQRVANDAIAKAKVSAIDATSALKWKQDLALKVERIQIENFTEDQLLRHHLTEKENELALWRGEDADREEQYQIQLANIYATYNNAVTKMHDDELKKRWGISNVYHQLDFNSAADFLGMMGQMMSSHNRAAFEVGKAAAEGQAIMDTYRAANGAYAALSGIPIIGPALGAAAAAAAIIAGIARVQQIKSTQFGGGSAAGGGSVATPVFTASPTTGLPTAPISPASSPILPPQLAAGSTQAPAPRTQVSLTLIGTQFSYDQVANEIIPLMNQAAGNGVDIVVTTV